MGPKKYIKKEESRLYKEKQIKTARDSTQSGRYQQKCNPSNNILTQSIVRQFNSQSRLRKSHSQAVIDNFDDDDAQSFPLDFDDRKILHLWLVDILPDLRNNKYKLNLLDKKITGNKYECQLKIKQCEDHIKKNKMKSLTKLQEEFDQYFLLYLKINQVKVYQKKIIFDVLQEIDQKFKYKNIKKILQNLQGQYFYLVSLKNQLEAGFIQWFYQNRDTKISKDLIEIARKKGRSIFLKNDNPQKSLGSSISFKKQKKKQKSDDEQQQSSTDSEQLGNYGFYGLNSSQNRKKTQDIEKIQQLKVENLKEEKIEKKNQNNLNEKKKSKFRKKSQSITSKVDDIPIKKQKNNIIFKQIYPKQYLDLEELKKWIQYNKTLKFDQFIFEDEGDSMIIMINTRFEQKRKLEAINIYFKFSKIILIHTLSAENISKLEQKFCKEKLPVVKCKLIEGYMDPSTHEHKLRSLIMDGKINKSERFSKKFIALWIEGLKSETQRIDDKIRNFIQQLPKEDKQENILIDLPKVQKYIYEDRVQDLCKQVIRNYVLKNYQDISIKDINIFAQKVTLKLKIRHEIYREFMKDDKHIKKLTEGIDKSIFIDEIFDSNELTTELSNKYLLFPSKENPAKIVIIQDHSRSSFIIKEIMNQIRDNQKSLQSYETNYSKGRVQLLKNYIDELNMIDKLKDLLKNIKISFEGQNKIVVFGNKKNASQIHNMINLYLTKLSDTIMEKTLIISEIEVGVMEKNMEKFKKDIQNQYKLSINLSKGIDYGAIISINPTKLNDVEQAPLIIFIQKHNHLSKLPFKTIVGFQSQRDLNFINEKMFTPIKAFFSNQKKDVINQKEDIQRETTYVYSESFINKTEDLLNYMYNVYPYQNENVKKFAFIMPKQDKNKFILSVIKVYEKLIQKNKINIYVLEQGQQNISSCLKNLEQQYKDLQKTTKYFVFDKKQFYYSKQGDQKINKALMKGKKIVHLTNEDLSLQNITHQCSFKEKKLIHIQSGKQTQIQIQNNRYFIELNGNIYEIPDKQVQKVIKQEPQVGWVQVSIGIYELNFTEMKQTNLFSGFVRDLQKKEIGVEKTTNHIQIDFNYKVNEIQIPYDEKQQHIAIKAIEKIKVLLSGEKIKLQHKLEKNITDSQFDKIKEVAKDFDVIAQWDGNQKIIFTYYDKINIANLTKNLKYILSEEKKEIKYPETWDKIEESEIKTFIVDKKTKQFEEVQKAFSLGSITELVRIQNTYVYKKYLDEKICLAQLNDGKEVRQLKLFHGTRNTDPKTIYEDKEESFNINYTSDNNFLGRGTYFAERSQYSHNYSYVNQNYSVEGPSNLVSRVFQRRNVPAREMFYCSVLVGDSQNVAKVDATSQAMKDTDFKNIAQRIRFQSSTTFTNGSVIYAVYKNRRAYPHYLIRY